MSVSLKRLRTTKQFYNAGVWTDAIISFLNLPGVTKAEDVLVKIFSDKRAYKKAQKYGLCIVGERDIEKVDNWYT